MGNATITDTREAEARADLAHSQQIAAENDLLVAKVTLDQLVGRNGVTPHPLVLPAVLPPVMPSQASDWVSMAESDSPPLKQSRLALEVAELETSRAKAGHLPTRRRRRHLRPQPRARGRQRPTARSPATAATRASR